MRIALVNPCADLELQTHRHGVGHLCLCYVAACLLRDGHDVRVIDAKTERLPVSVVVDRIGDSAPSIVGVTAMTHEITHAAQICAAVKQVCPRCVTIVGGPHATALPERTLREFRGIDVAVRGEGERTACELAAAVNAGAARSDWSAIAGMAFRNGDEVCLTPTRPETTDLDALPFPAWELFPRKAHWPLYAGRGCPFRCAFCQRVLGGRIRMRSVDNVLAEIDELEARTGIRASWFQDETFGASRSWTHEFLDRLIARSERKGYVWRWKANFRANLTDPALYRKMRRAGCKMLDFGIESGSAVILKRIHKDITLEQARRAIRAARAAGIRTNAFFIIGHPGENWATALQTARFAARVGADDIAVGVMVPYPGTEIWEMAHRGQWGYRLVSEDWRFYDKYLGHALELRKLSHRELELLQSLTYLAFYATTGRFVELSRFVLRFRGEAMHMMKRLSGLRVPSARRTARAGTLGQVQDCVRTSPA